MTSETAPYRLGIERTLDAPRAAVWRCWTEPALIKQWFCPKPWSVAEADFDVRPGGRMNMVMAGPNGERVESTGAWLEVVKGVRLVFSDALCEGFTPQKTPFMSSVAEFSDAPDGGTRMIWSARHASAEDRAKHIDMGFEAGWNAAADQLEALAQSIADDPATELAAAKSRTCLFFKDQAEDAARFYASLLPGDEVERVLRPEPGGPAMAAEFTIGGAPYVALNGNPEPKPSAMASIAVLAETQAEIDRLWAALTDGGAPLQCGWLQDRFGVHWQIAPKALPRLLTAPDRDAAQRAMTAMLGMVKLDLAALEAAYRGA